VAKKVGLAPSAIRYYEEMGLLGQVQRQSGQRVFADEVAQRLELIKLLVSSGFSLNEIRLLISDRSPGREDSRALGRRKLAEIECTMREIAGTQAIIEWGLRCKCRSFDECTCEIDAGNKWWLWKLSASPQNVRQQPGRGPATASDGVSLCETSCISSSPQRQPSARRRAAS
jgi:DNA-binding transcriptional MerR regulator